MLDDLWQKELDIKPQRSAPRVASRGCATLSCDYPARSLLAAVGLFETRMKLRGTAEVETPHFRRQLFSRQFVRLRSNTRRMLVSGSSPSTNLELTISENVSWQSFSLNQPSPGKCYLRFLAPKRGPVPACAERALPPGAHSSQTCLGGRYASPQGVPCRCADDLAGCWARPSP